MLICSANWKPGVQKVLICWSGAPESQWCPVTASRIVLSAVFTRRIMEIHVEKHRSGSNAEKVGLCALRAAPRSVIWLTLFPIETMFCRFHTSNYVTRSLKLNTYGPTAFSVSLMWTFWVLLCRASNQITSHVDMMILRQRHAIRLSVAAVLHGCFLATESGLL